MFVIVQCWYNLSPEKTKDKSLHEKIGLTMKHAGVAITVTSLTDVFAFGIGAVTVSFPYMINASFWTLNDGSIVTSLSGSFYS